MDLEALLLNPGLSHIVSNISRFLDVKSMAQCRLVSQAWKDVIDNQREWLIFQLDYINRSKKNFFSCSSDSFSIMEKFPEWHGIIETFIKVKSISRLKDFVNYLWIYFEDEEVNRPNPLHYAIVNSNIGFVQLLIEVGIDLNMRNRSGKNCLHVACEKGSIEMVQYIISHFDFDPTLKTKDGRTIFHFAAMNENCDVAKLICSKFKFDNCPDEEGLTPLYTALAMFAPIETVKFLLESRHVFGIDLDTRTRKTQGTILHFACLYRDIEIIDLIYKELQSANSSIDFDTRNNDLKTPLQCAYENTDYIDTAVNLLQMFPGKVNAPDNLNNGMNMVHFVCEEGNLELLKALHQNPSFDIDYNVVDEEGFTPLHLACNEGHLEVVKFLLQDVNPSVNANVVEDINGYTPLELARSGGHVDITNFLEKYQQPRWAQQPPWYQQPQLHQQPYHPMWVQHEEVVTSTVSVAPTTSVGSIALVDLTDPVASATPVISATP